MKDAPNSDPKFDPNYTFEAPLDSAQINTDQIFKLVTTLTLRRKPPLVAGELATAAGVASAATVLAPCTEPLANRGTERTLAQFAQNFTNAFDNVPGVSYRIATGSDRNVFTGGGKSPLWVVQLGRTGAGQPISYTIKDANAPTIFAPRPISNVLKSKQQTPIIEYATGTVISLQGKSAVRSFLSIDLDTWMRTTLAEIDELLTPKYVVPADILRRKIQDVAPPTGWKDALQEVLDAKKSLADKLRAVLIPVYKGQGANAQQLRDIREAFYQQMLGTMGQFYDVTAGVQFEAEVQSAIKQHPGPGEVPRIFGDIIMNPVVNPPVAGAGGDRSVDDKSVSLSSPKLDLKFGSEPGSHAPAPSPYLSSLVSSTATDAKSVLLNLEYNGQYIEHEIGILQGIDGYKPSSWLSFVDISSRSSAQDDKNSPLRVELGQFYVPIVLREFPDTPTLVNHSACLTTSISPDQRRPLPLPSGRSSPSRLQAQPVRPYDPLDTATRWNYAFEYSMQVHRQQDEIHGTVSFNIPDTAFLMAADVAARDLFDNLAQFVNVYPAVRDDLNTYLATIDVETTDSDQIKKAQTALESAAEMINWLAESFQHTSPRK